MGHFRTGLKVTQVDQDRWRLDRDVVFVSDLIGVVRVPRGFITDFASVPRLPLAYALVGNKAQPAAVIHDWLYSTHEVSRKTADAVLYEAIRAAGHGWFTGNLMWLGVRVGGWVAWDKPNLPQDPHVEDQLYAN